MRRAEHPIPSEFARSRTCKTYEGGGNFCSSVPFFCHFFHRHCSGSLSCGKREICVFLTKRSCSESSQSLPLNCGTADVVSATPVSGRRHDCFSASVFLRQPGTADRGTIRHKTRGTLSSVPPLVYAQQEFESWSEPRVHCW